MHYPIEELHTVIGLWIKAARKTGNPVPKPSNRADVNYSGKFLMRVPNGCMRSLRTPPRPRE